MSLGNGKYSAKFQGKLQGKLTNPQRRTLRKEATQLGKITRSKFLTKFCIGSTILTLSAVILLLYIPFHSFQ